jgi:type III pantothenate kinase
LEILAVDAGNTRIKWGVLDGRHWNPGGALPTAEAERLAQAWSAVPHAIPVIASNVAGAEVERHLRGACADRRLTIIASQREQLGVRNGYRDPGQLGSDRWAGLVAAHHAHPGHKLVVNAGTALTIDALRADGEFAGGIIVPGPALMRRALDRGTAGLRLTEGAFAEFPASTPDAIASGTLQACVGAIERMRAAMSAHGWTPVRLILSGGAAQELRPHLPGDTIVEDNLVLEGLARIARND